IALSTILIIQSTILNFWQSSYTSKELEDPIFQEMSEKKSRILFIESARERSTVGLINFNFWKLKTFSENETTNMVFNDQVHNAEEITKLLTPELIENNDYAITFFELDYPLIIETNYHQKLYKIQK